MARFVLALPILFTTAVLGSPAFAMAPDVERVLAAEVGRCFSLPAGAHGVVTVSFDLDQTGHVLGTPRVDGFTSPGFGKAAVHAVVMCQPYSLPASRFTDWQHARVRLPTGQ